MGDDNAAASANARGGLGALGDFLYRNSVVAPQVRANTAATQAATADQLQQTDQSNQLFPVHLASQKNLLHLQNLNTDEAVQKSYLDTIQRPNSPDDLPRSGSSDVNDDNWAAVPHAPRNPYDPSVPFLQQPADVQKDLIRKIQNENPVSGRPVKDSDAIAALVGEDNRRLQATLPPITPYSLPGGLGVTKLTGGPAGVTFEATDPGVTPITDASGARTGFVKAGGEVKPDPMALAPEKIEAAKAGIDELKKSQSDVQKIQDMIGQNPDLVGPGVISGGSAIPHTLRVVGAYAGAPSDYAKQKQLDMFLTGRLLDTLNQVHIGRVTELEWNQLKNNIPSQGSPKEVWDDYLSRLQDTIGKAVSAHSEVLRQNGTPYTSTPYSAKLPPVNPKASQVSQPDSSTLGDSSKSASSESVETAPNSGTAITTQAEFDALPKGAKFTFRGKAGIKSR